VSASRVLFAVLAVTLLASTMAATTPPGAADPTGAATAERDARARSAADPLRGLTIALDPGHQLGNHSHPRQIEQAVPAGGFRKPCNTTGAATASGVPEATVTFRLASAVKRRLEAVGATVRMTRNTNSQRDWGPCIDARGRFGQRVGAQLMVSLHADGSSSSGRGFHVIAPTSRRPWTTDIAGPSLRLAKILRASLDRSGVPRADYTAADPGLDLRGDLATLNLSDVPVAMVEIGNMRNARDARRMTSAPGRATYADAVVRGIRTYLRR
jgi:N-acetylmuramoyl-L-alanine amidase